MVLLKSFFARCTLYTHYFFLSVHVKVDEKITLTGGRDGGLQNMEIRGLVLLRISDPQFGKICVKLENNDDKGFQMQVTIEAISFIDILFCSVD